MPTWRRRCAWPPVQSSARHPFVPVCASRRLTSSALELRCLQVEVSLMNEPTPVALVTGANRGLGLVIARVLARRGYKLVIGGRDRTALDNAAAELSSYAPAVIPIAGDITDQSLRAEFIDAADRLGGLNVLVNNAS